MIGDYNLGDEVMVSRTNDNENYDRFRGKKLIIVDKITSEDEHPAFDSSMEGQALYSFETKNGNHVPFSLYDYELEPFDDDYDDDDYDDDDDDYENGGQVPMRSIEQEAQSMIGNDWFQLTQKDQAELIAAFVLDDVLKYDVGGGVPTAIQVKYTMFDGSIVTKTYDSQEEADNGIADYFIEHDVADVEIVKEKKKSLFEKAKEDPKKPASKKDKLEVVVEGIEGDIAEYHRINQRIKSLEAEKELLSGKLKEIGKSKFLELYEQKNKKPENFNLADGDEQILYMVQDKYIKVSDEKATLLKALGEDLVETITTYEFDKETIEKKVGNKTIGDMISDLIENSKEIPDSDKAKLIKAKVETRVPKGTIERLMEYDNFEEVFNMIEPIQALK